MTEPEKKPLLERIITSRPLKLILGGVTVSGVFGFIQFLFNNHLATQKEKTKMVNDYIESVQTLVFDQYYSANKQPKIGYSQIEIFIKAKTSTTFKALDNDTARKEILIKFLRDSKIGFSSRDGNERTPVLIPGQEITSFLSTISLYKVNFEQFNLDWLKAKNGEFTETNLVRTTFYSANMEKAIFRKADMKGVQLIKANLKGANFQNADLSRSFGFVYEPSDCNFNNFCGFIKNSNLTQSNLREAVLRDTNLRYADLKAANLVGTKLDEQTRIDGAQFNYALIIYPNYLDKNDSERQFDKNNLTKFSKEQFDILNKKYCLINLIPQFDKKKALDSNKLCNKKIDDQDANKYEYEVIKPFKEKDLSNVDLTQSDLSELDFTGADFTGANLTKADLRGANLTKANLTKADLRGANLTKADLRGANLTKADLRGATLIDNNLEKAKLEETKIDNAKFVKDNSNKTTNNKKSPESKWKIVWRIVNHDNPPKSLKKQDLSNSYLKNADLSAANLSGTNLSGTNLSGTNLSAANLSGANLSGANLSGANLSGANLSGANLSGAKGVKLPKSTKICNTRMQNGELQYCTK